MHESPDDYDDEAPCACALVARAVTLMTEWADPSTGHIAPADVYRTQLARQLASDLLALRKHPGLSPGLRHAMGHAHLRWVALARPASAAVADTGLDDMPSARRGVSMH